MRDQEQVFSVAAMSRVLRVTRPGYYAWKHRRPSARARADEALRTDIRAVFAASRRSYGSRRIRQALLRQGRRVGRPHVVRLMSQEGLRAKRSACHRRVTTDSRNTTVVHANVLARDFAVGTANRAWAGDITYLWTQEGWLYLAVVIDMFSRQVVGWPMDRHIPTGHKCGQRWSMMPY